MGEIPVGNAQLMRQILLSQIFLIGLNGYESTRAESGPAPAIPWSPPAASVDTASPSSASAAIASPVHSSHSSPSSSQSSACQSLSRHLLRRDQRMPGPCTQQIPGKRAHFLRMKHQEPSLHIGRGTVIGMHLVRSDQKYLSLSDRISYLIRTHPHVSPSHPRIISHLYVQMGGKIERGPQRSHLDPVLPAPHKTASMFVLLTRNF